MIYKKTKYLKVWMALTAIVLSISLSSCSLLPLESLFAEETVSGASVNFDSMAVQNESSANTTASTEKTEPSEESSAEENEKETDSVQQIIQNNTVTIVGGQTNVAYAAASGLRSAVSVYCFYTQTTGGNSFWTPTPTTKTYYSAGSGVIYTLEEGGSAFVVTNFHVVYDGSSDSADGISEEIYLYLYGMESDKYAIPATFVGGSAKYDLAVLRVEQSEILKAAMASGSAIAATVGDSDSLMPGQTSIAIGNPASEDLEGLSVTCGVISVDSEYIVMNAVDNSGEAEFRVIRIDTPVNPGNSGGGLYNDKGELIGIVNAKTVITNVESIGYAIPSNVVRAVADNIIDHCYGKDCKRVMRGTLGISVAVTGLSTYYDSDLGVLRCCEEISVYEVTAGGLGAEILQAGDLILSITVGNRTVEVTRQHHLIDAMLDARIGAEISLKILRNGETLTVSTVITEASMTAA